MSIHISSIIATCTDPSTNTGSCAKYIHTATCRFHRPERAHERVLSIHISSESMTTCTGACHVLRPQKGLQAQAHVSPGLTCVSLPHLPSLPLSPLLFSPLSLSPSNPPPPSSPLLPLVVSYRAQCNGERENLLQAHHVGLDVGREGVKLSARQKALRAPRVRILPGLMYCLDGAGDVRPSRHWQAADVVVGYGSPCDNRNHRILPERFLFPITHFCEHL